jgi:uncharacterized protein
MSLPQNYAQALNWLRKAASQGEPGAQFNLGVMYYNGEGVPQNYLEAEVWLSLSASRSIGREQQQRAGIRDMVAGKLSPQQLAEAQRRGKEWKPSGGDVGK